MFCSLKAEMEIDSQIQYNKDIWNRPWWPGVYISNMDFIK